MTKAPHDIADLHLAPVLLALDARLEELGRLPLEDLRSRIATESNGSDRGVELRISGVLASVRYLLDCHRWELSWDPRGIRVRNHGRSVVLGIPDVIVEYVAGRHHAQPATTDTGSRGTGS
ncbi:hypothetical protein [Nocardioides salsibiostraticola]